ncbi:hypothetical protein HY639_02305 [Candidatus Woesearchaeota archaeon]|nr:hypothetical protein [Candidatus Woesearchaeota archaeon]
MKKALSLLLSGALCALIYNDYKENQYRQHLASPAFRQSFAEDMTRAKRRERPVKSDEFSLAIIVDKEVKAQWERYPASLSWDDNLFNAVEETSRRFHAEFGVGFAPTYIASWDSPDEINNADVLLLYGKSLGRLIPRKTDMVLFCTGQELVARQHYILGIAESPGRYVLVNATYMQRTQTLVIQHELSHTLNADHTDDFFWNRYYLMYPGYSMFSTGTWDDWNKRKMRQVIGERRKHAQVSS